MKRTNVQWQMKNAMTQTLGNADFSLGAGVPPCTVSMYVCTTCPNFMLDVHTNNVKSKGCFHRTNERASRRPSDVTRSLTPQTSVASSLTIFSILESLQFPSTLLHSSHESRLHEEVCDVCVRFAGTQI